MAAKQDPSPAEIAAACLEIQRGWSEQEKLKRLRVDLRPTYRTADGRRLEMTEVAYDRHHERPDPYAGQKMAD